MDVEKLILAISNVASAGPWGLAGATILIVFSLWLYVQWNKIKREAAHNETEQGRSSDQASNDVDNAKADQDAAKAEDDIEGVINGNGRQ